MMLVSYFSCFKTSSSSVTMFEHQVFNKFTNILLCYIKRINIKISFFLQINIRNVCIKFFNYCKCYLSGCKQCRRRSGSLLANFTASYKADSSYNDCADMSFILHSICTYRIYKEKTE